LAWQEEEKQRRMEQVLQVAMQELAKQGYEDTSMELLAEKSGFTRKTLYNYFGSKEEIVLQLLCRSLTSVVQRFEAKADLPLLGGDILREFGVAFEEFSREEPELFMMQTLPIPMETSVEDFPSGKCFLQARDQIRQVMMAAIKKGQADGSVRQELDPMMATLYMSMMSTQFILSVNSIPEAKFQQIGVNKAAFYDFILDMIGYSLSPQAGGEKSEGCGKK
jgi:AcrR family transcriptional regulator